MDTTIVLGVVGLAILVILIIGSVVTRFKVAGPDEAFIITGRKGKKSRNAEGEIVTDLSGQKVVLGGGVFVVPFVQRLHTLDLSARRITVAIRGAVTQAGVKVNLEAVAIVKVGGDSDSIRAAAQRFLSQQGAIDAFTTEVLSGALRSIVGGLTVEEIIRDRAAFANKVFEESEASLTGQGLVLDTFQVQEITDEGSYLDDLGRPEAARVKREADIAEAKALQESQQATLLAEEQIAIANRNLALKQASILSETEAAAAKASAAGPLEAAAQKQLVLATEEKVAVAQAALTERQLDTEVRKPADAEKYRVEQEAEGRKAARIAQAQADRESTILEAQARREAAELAGEGVRSERVAIAAAALREAEVAATSLQLEGQAQAAAIGAKGNAEAEAMTAKADAFEKFGEAAILQMLVEMLPKITAEAAAPMAAIDNLTIVSTDGAGALPKQVTSTVTETNAMMKAATGIDLTSFLGEVMNKYAKPENTKPNSIEPGE